MNMEIQLEVNYLKHYTDSRVKNMFVTSIKHGLDDAMQLYSTGKYINNSKHFYKMDAMANAIIDQISNDSNFKLVKIKRGSYIVPLFYCVENSTIYSIMSSSKFKELITRSDLAHIHYYDGLIYLNEKLNIPRKQLVLNDNMFIRDNYQIDIIKESVKDQLDGYEPDKYMSLSVTMDMFNLRKVECILTSEYLEVSYEEDWSEFIEIDYNDIDYTINATDEIDEEDDNLNITIKPDISRKDDISEKHITPKVGIKENQA